MWNNMNILYVQYVAITYTLHSLNTHFIPRKLRFKHRFFIATAVGWHERSVNVFLRTFFVSKLTSEFYLIPSKNLTFLFCVFTIVRFMSLQNCILQVVGI